MNRKKFLIGSVAALTIFGFIAISSVFTSSLNPSAKAHASISRVQIEQAKNQGIVFLNHSLIFIVAVTPEISDSLNKLNNNVWSSAIHTKLKTQSGSEFLVFSAVSTKGNNGCVLKHVPPGKSNPIVANQVWLGGFVDQCGDVSFDYAGRAIQNPRYSYFNYAAKTDNLSKPLGLSEKNGWLVVTGYER